MAWTGTVAFVMATAIACSTDDAAPPAPTPSATSTTPSSRPSATPSAASTTPARPPANTPGETLAPAPNPVSLQALMTAKYNGGDLRLELSRNRFPALPQSHALDRSLKCALHGRPLLLGQT